MDLDYHSGGFIRICHNPGKDKMREERDKGEEKKTD